MDEDNSGTGGGDMFDTQDERNEHCRGKHFTISFANGNEKDERQPRKQRRKKRPAAAPLPALAAAPPLAQAPTDSFAAVFPTIHPAANNLSIIPAVVLTRATESVEPKYTLCQPGQSVMVVRDTHTEGTHKGIPEY
eukprot:scaffold7338_cov107-Cylindrotheca_fusiformis.AAC.2